MDIMQNKNVNILDIIDNIILEFKFTRSLVIPYNIKKNREISTISNRENILKITEYDKEIFNLENRIGIFDKILNGKRIKLGKFNIKLHNMVFEINQKPIEKTTNKYIKQKLNSIHMIIYFLVLTKLPS